MASLNSAISGLFFLSFESSIEHIATGNLANSIILWKWHYIQILVFSVNSSFVLLLHIQQYPLEGGLQKLSVRIDIAKGTIYIIIFTFV